MQSDEAYAEDLSERAACDLVGSGTASMSAVPWSPLKRLAFRIAALYFFCFMFFGGNGTLFLLFFGVQGWIEQKLSWPVHVLATWSAQHVFHLSGLAGSFHPTGSGDTAIQWILQLIFAAGAIVGGLLWTLLATLRGKRRTEYSLLYAWLRFLLRLTIAMFLLDYGLSKFFPGQMPPISIAVLNENVGQTSPMTLLWSLIGMNPLYETVCGAAEITGGVLLLFRRTALAGALLSVFVMTNVLLFNLFFDVPVKLFAANFLLALLFLIIPDLGPLWNFFWRHTPTKPVGVWLPAHSRRGFRVATRTVEVLYVVLLIVIMPIMEGYGWLQFKKQDDLISPLQGAWHLDNERIASGAFITGDGLPGDDLYIDTPARAFMRSTDRALWRTDTEIDDKAHTVKVECYGGKPVSYAWTMTDRNHLLLRELSSSDGKSSGSAEMTFTRIPLPAAYPLLERGFHWVNERGLER